MRGIPSLITDIRKQVFAEVARMAYSGDYTQMEDIPFRIVPGTNPLHRESVFLERAIAGERVRLAMGLSLQPVQTRTLLTEGMDQAAIAEQYYEAPLVNIIPYACHACPTKQYRVTELCQGCLAARKRPYGELSGQPPLRRQRQIYRRQSADSRSDQKTGTVSQRRRKDPALFQSRRQASRRDRRGRRHQRRQPAGCARASEYGRSRRDADRRQ